MVSNDIFTAPPTEEELQDTDVFAAPPTEEELAEPKEEASLWDRTAAATEGFGDLYTNLLKRGAALTPVGQAMHKGGMFEPETGILGRTEEEEKAESAGIEGGAQAATVGFADELEGAGKAAIEDPSAALGVAKGFAKEVAGDILSSFPGIKQLVDSGVISKPQIPNTDQEFKDMQRMEELANMHIDSARARGEKKLREKPGAYLGGGLIAGAALPSARLGKGVSLLQKMLVGAGEGLGYGASYGLGAGEGDVGERLESSGEGGLYGTLIGAGIPVVGRALRGTGSLIKKGGNKILPKKEYAFGRTKELPVKEQWEKDIHTLGTVTAEINQEMASRVGVYGKEIGDLIETATKKGDMVDIAEPLNRLKAELQKIADGMDPDAAKEAKKLIDITDDYLFGKYATKFRPKASTKKQLKSESLEKELAQLNLLKKGGFPGKEQKKFVEKISAEQMVKEREKYAATTRIMLEKEGQYSSAEIKQITDGIKRGKSPRELDIPDLEDAPPLNSFEAPVTVTEPSTGRKVIKAVDETTGEAIVRGIDEIEPTKIYTSTDPNTGVKLRHFTDKSTQKRYWQEVPEDIYTPIEKFQTRTGAKTEVNPTELKEAEQVFKRRADVSPDATSAEKLVAAKATGAYKDMQELFPEGVRAAQKKYRELTEAAETFAGMSPQELKKAGREEQLAALNKARQLLIAKYGEDLTMKGADLGALEKGFTGMSPGKEFKGLEDIAPDIMGKIKSEVPPLVDDITTASGIIGKDISTISTSPTGQALAGTGGFIGAWKKAGYHSGRGVKLTTDNLSEQTPEVLKTLANKLMYGAKGGGKNPKQALLLSKKLTEAATTADSMKKNAILFQILQLQVHKDMINEIALEPKGGQ